MARSLLSSSVMKIFTLLDPSVVRLLLAGSVALGGVTLTRAASAACEVDDDCGFGFECVHMTDRGDSAVTGGSSGTSGGSGGSSSSACDNGSCEWDESFESCPEDCNELTECEPAECTADDQCAEGYTCEAAGTASVSSSSAGEHVEFEYRCQLAPVACESDADCGAGLHCVVPSEGTSGSSTAVTSGSSDTTGSSSAGDGSTGGTGGTSGDSDGSDGSDGSGIPNIGGGGDDGVDGSTEGYCAPEETGNEGSGGSTGASGSTDAGTGPTDSTGAGPTGTVGGTSDGAGETGGSNNTSGVGGASAGSSDDSSGGPSASTGDGNADGDGENEGGGGCSVSGPALPAGGDIGTLSLLGALMFGWFQRRRRALV